METVKRNSVGEVLHTFVICAYKESPYLEECIQSLEAQTVQSRVVLATSTPCEYIDRIAKAHNIEVEVNHGDSGITQDWNFALSLVDTKYATIAHQDDVYESEYTNILLERMERENKPIIGFSDYYEIRNGIKTVDVSMLKIKRFMMLPLRPRFTYKSRFIRRRVLSMGDPICCPSVCFCLEQVERPIFKHHYRSCEDWEAWEKLSKQKGSFIYVSKPLMSHRIHEESTTSEIIKDNARVQENYEMFCKFWPSFLAKFINHFYTKSEKSNDLDN